VIRAAAADGWPSVSDKVNSWCREAGVPEADFNEASVLRAVDELWAKTSAPAATPAPDPDESTAYLRKHAHALAMLALQSERYASDAEYRQEVDAVLADRRDFYDTQDRYEGDE